MTPTTTRNTPTPLPAAEFAFPPGAVLDNFRNMLNASHDLVRGWAAINAEMMEFTTQQLRRNAEVWTHARTLDDAFKAQADAATAAIAQCFDAANKIAKIGSQALTESCATLQKKQGTNRIDASEPTAAITAAA